MVGADRGRHLAGEPDRLADVGRVRAVGRVRVAHAEDRDGGLEHSHRIRRLRHQPERLNQIGGNLARRDERQGGLVELRRVREIAVPEQVAHFLEAGATRQVLDVVATVGEASVAAVEIAELRLGGDDALESANELSAFLIHHRLATLRSLDGSRIPGARPPARPALMSGRGEAWTTTSTW